MAQLPGETYIELVATYADDPKMAALLAWPEDTRGSRELFIQMLCYSKLSMTDGRVPRVQVVKLGFPDAPAVSQRQAEHLAEVGLIVADGTDWVIPSYLKRNRSRAEIVARTEALQASGAESGGWGNHRRWHVERGIVKIDCTYCRRPDSGVPDGTDSGEPEGTDSGIGIAPNRTETETETETETYRATKRRRGSRITKDWKPTAEDITWARERGIPDSVQRRECERFVDYWIAVAGQKGTKLDWSATWRNWLRRAWLDKQPGSTSTDAAAKVRARQTNPLASAL